MRRVPATIVERSRRQYAADVLHLDDAVGALLAALEKSGKAKRTLVSFSSDNGGYPIARNDDPQYPADNYDPGPAGGDNRPLRGMKMTVYEDGQAQSALARWTFNYLISTPPLVRSSPIDAGSGRRPIGSSRFWGSGRR